MKATFIAALLPILMTCSPVPSVAGNDADLTEKVSKILKESEEVKPGMKREELMKVYTTEGGISTVTKRTFVHRHCVYIKVDVEFDLAGNVNGMTERPSDRISKISKPYLAWSIID